MSDMNLKDPLESKVVRLILMILLIIGGFKLIHEEVSNFNSNLQATILGSYLILVALLCLKYR